MPVMLTTTMAPGGLEFAYFCLIPALAVVFHVPWGKKDASTEEIKKKGQA